MDDALDSIGLGWRYFSTLVLAMGYQHIPIREEDRPKTAFSTRHGLFQFKVMPFGLKYAGYIPKIDGKNALENELDSMPRLHRLRSLIGDDVQWPS